MDIAWADLGLVLGVGLLLGVGVVALYAAGIRALATGGPGDRTPPANVAIAGLCFAICVAAVLFGVWTLL